ncbi:MULTISPECIES: ExbD/TolR family protein [Bacteria]|jgi:biopolymer transport protein ExbD|uniref:Biopolymer transporter ExbD n=3 Tax=Sphingomonas TaxID=13687 RepID=A0A0D1K0S0_9SPHN|nr:MULTISPECIES: biopolymer transporter ExbD [Sphingomonas]MCI1142781.1 biopolymer transporter ExbD [Sphingomonas sp. WKB10]ANC85825.1 biopolymer transporter ExbD [Sphingomonas sp. NIC1]AOW24089.1 biopolymer transporter ExbD [Sphingomonas melonis TY]KIU27068.1 biopolymer transporter ExbD [Sphingomonas melonis]KZB96492.1 biopolymer transporter ExbD [Sphingomonas melonis TY]
MAMSTGGGGSSEKPMSDINTTPLVDVMLVLLIIFLIAVPVAIQTVKGIVLPKVRFDPTTTKPENVLLSVTSGPDGNCLVYWGTSPITSKDLLTRAVDKLKLEIERQGGAGNPNLELPEVHIRGDVNTPYKCIGGTIYTMQQAGFAKVGFISQPPPAGG